MVRCNYICKITYDDDCDGKVAEKNWTDWWSWHEMMILKDLLIFSDEIMIDYKLMYIVCRTVVFIHII